MLEAELFLIFLNNRYYTVQHKFLLKFPIILNLSLTDETSMIFINHKITKGYDKKRIMRERSGCIRSQIFNYFIFK